MSFLTNFLHQIVSYWHQMGAYYALHKSVIDVAVMPFMYGFVGWLTNWQAVKMIFWPNRFWGIPPYLGWQGIVPKKAVKFATRTTDYLSSRLVHLDEIFDRLDPRVIAKKLEPVADELINDIVNEVFEKSNPLTWKLMPDLVRDEIVKASRRQLPKGCKLVIEDIQQNIFKIFDLMELAIESMTGDNVDRMVNLVKTLGKKEFELIINTGFYYGFLLGLVQVLIWMVYPALWTIPVQGAIVGYLTNWLAIYMIFEPVDEKKYFFGLIKWQGLFIKRRLEVSRGFSELIEKDVLNSKNIIRKILTGKERSRINLIIRMGVSQAIDRLSSPVKPLITSTLQTDVIDLIKHEISMELTHPESMKLIEDYVHEALNVKQIMIDRFAELTPAQYSELLRPIFHEDEWILILVGGVLGAAVGVVQLFMMLYL